MRRVTFQSQGETIVGHFYLPKGASAFAPVPAIVVTGAWFTVKEQMPATYARAMADRGYAALAFDFRGFGESGGAVRQREIPSDKINDILAAVDFLKGQPEVKATRIAGLGICASSGYMVAAATRAPDFKAVALVAPWLHDATLVETIYGGPDAVRGLMDAGRAAAAAYSQTGTQRFVPGASTTDRNAVMFGVPYYTETDRGMIPAWRNEIDPAFWEGWLTFDALAYAPRLGQPFLMVESEAAALPQGARQFYAALKAPKAELWLDDATQFDFYDRERPVTASADAIAEHFRTS